MREGEKERGGGEREGSIVITNKRLGVVIDLPLLLLERIHEARQVHDPLLERRILRGITG